LAQKIAKAHERKGFCGAIVYGARGIGKSSYAIKVMRDLFQMQGLSEDQAYDEALKLMKFRIEDVINFVRHHADTENLAMVLVIDDAGAHLSKFLWWEKPHEVRLLQAMTDTIRSALSSMILTCPSPKSVLNFLRTTYDDFFVRISAESGDWRRVAKGYKMFTLPSGKTVVNKVFEDRFSCYLPDDVYAKYDRMRKSYLKEALSELEKFMGKSAEAEALEGDF
jgi:hypothetical protein